MRKKIITFILQVITVTACFTICMWLFNVVFDKESAFNVEMLLQGLVFSIIYVPLSSWWSARSR